MWHRTCATLESGADKSAASSSSSSAAAASAAAPVPAPSANSLAPSPSTHVMPFTPLTTPYWYCSDCYHVRGYCFACFNPGTCDPDQEKIETSFARRKTDNPDYLYQCPFQGGCGKLYHRACLFSLPRTMTHKPSRTNAGGKDSGSASAAPTPNLVPRPRAGLICGLHACNQCGSAGTASTNVRDIGRTLVHCLRCPVAFHWSTKCRREDDHFITTTKKYGVCQEHNLEAEPEPDESDEVEIAARREASIKQTKLTYGIAPTALFGAEPREEVEENSDDEDGEDDEEEEEEQEEEEDPDHEEKARTTKNKADKESDDAPPLKKQRAQLR